MCLVDRLKLFGQWRSAGTGRPEHAVQLTLVQQTCQKHNGRFTVASGCGWVLLHLVDNRVSYLEVLVHPQPHSKVACCWVTCTSFFDQLHLLLSSVVTAGLTHTSWFAGGATRRTGKQCLYEAEVFGCMPCLSAKGILELPSVS